MPTRSLCARRIHFEDLIPVYPNSRLYLESDPKDVTTRLIDMVAPSERDSAAGVSAQRRARRLY